MELERKEREPRRSYCWKTEYGVGGYGTAAAIASGGLASLAVLSVFELFAGFEGRYLRGGHRAQWQNEDTQRFLIERIYVKM